jgi:hypothetical protein
LTMYRTAVLLVLSVPPFQGSDPPLSDLHRFPPHERPEAAVRFNRAHACWLSLRGSIETDPVRLRAYGDWYADNERCCVAWLALELATSERDDAGKPVSVDWRRSRLRELREAIGWEAYYEGRMPPPVPVWRLLVLPDGCPGPRPWMPCAEEESAATPAAGAIGEPFLPRLATAPPGKCTLPAASRRT